MTGITKFHLLLQDNSKVQKKTTTTTATNNSSATTMRLSGPMKRSHSEEQTPPVKKRLKPNHVSSQVSHPAFRPGQLTRKMGETVVVFDPKMKNVVYDKTRGQVQQSNLVIKDVRSFGSVSTDRSSNKDPLAIVQPAGVSLPTLSEVAIIPLKSPQNARSVNNNRTTPSSPSTSAAGQAQGQNGYTTTPDITIRTVPRITSPIPGSSRTSSMSSPGAASSTSTSRHAPDAPKKDPEDAGHVKPVMNQTFIDLLEVCKAADQSKEMDLITTKLVKYYHGVHRDFVNSVSFNRTVEKATTDIKSQPAQVFWVLKSVVDELKIRQGGVKVTADGEIVTENDEAVITGDPKTDKKLYKLNRVLCVTQRKIERLREQDTIWEEENNSAYVIIGRFEKRAVEIYQKICELTGESSDANRRVKKPIRFNKTQYTEFNKAVQSFYNKTHNFPDFYDVLKVLEYCNSQYDYGLKGETLKAVAQSAFQELGEKLQGRRKLEEYESLTYFSSLAGDDPANHDPELARKLEENKKYHTRIDEVINKYAEGRHLEANKLVRGSTKRGSRLDSGASHDSGNDDGENPPELLNGSNPPTPQNNSTTENNNISTNKSMLPKTTPRTPEDAVPAISASTEVISMAPELLSLDDVALLDASSLHDISLIDGS